MNSRLETATQIILDVAKDQDIAHWARIDLLDAVQKIMRGHAEYEEQMRELRELLYRNPAFPDDMVGRWDDDYDLPDEDDDKDENKPSSKKF